MLYNHIRGSLLNQHHNHIFTLFYAVAPACGQTFVLLLNFIKTSLWFSVSVGKMDTHTYGNLCVCVYLHALIKPTDRCVMWPSRTFTVLGSPRKRTDQSARCFHPNTCFLNIELAPPPNLSCNSSGLFRRVLIGPKKSVFVRPVRLSHFLLVLSLLPLSVTPEMWRALETMWKNTRRHRQQEFGCQTVQGCVQSPWTILHIEWHLNFLEIITELTKQQVLIFLRFFLIKVYQYLISAVKATFTT